MSERKRLTIDWQNLEMAFEHVPGEFQAFDQANYFDLQSGRVIFVDHETRSALRCIEEDLGEECEEIEHTDTFQSLPDWQKETARAAADVEFGDFTRYEEISQFDSRKAYEYMEDFVETVRDPVMQNRLSDALQRRGPFRHFRSVLADDRRLQRQWREYEIRRQHETMTQWLRSLGIEPANPEGRERNWQPLPDLRKIMFAEIRRFVRFACDLPGVERIALIGSLATDKEFPKDIDMLVTVSNDCDLTELASLGRQLSGHMLSHGAGADVFLADTDDNYLGKTCPWRECGPGIRASCDALHCGARHYLHDDLKDIRLPNEVVAQPPVVLWPEPTGNNVPKDVHEQLIEQLIQDESR